MPSSKIQISRNSLDMMLNHIVTANQELSPALINYNARNIVASLSGMLQSTEPEISNRLAKAIGLILVAHADVYALMPKSVKATTGLSNVSDAPRTFSSAAA